MNNKSKVQNPLTIIAIFAGIAELAGTTVLLGLPLEIQSVFVWFVMLFPIGLVAAFFMVLLFKHNVLYAPSDFVDENNFMNLLQNKKVQHELIEVADLLEEIKENNTANEQLKQDINEAMFKLEIAKQNNEQNYEAYKKIKSYENNDINLTRSINNKLSRSIVDVVRNAGQNGIPKQHLEDKFGGSFNVFLSYFIPTLIEKKIIRLEDGIFYYNIE